ncbi:hypothetical protein PAXRUDRAFT_822895 [Paxillus rubicundulus Ve08.2h10]|uniref:Unplaced genomic scaffold scaffold_41, whole genome shotgun sequence n=1 Tax=Paxillus rubicundulus Ve08.2h10 TaxID=930991 RepID=A0A0D0DW22_9AGAM|nr:hypothetical protein PAXRUDRAFT_822895 [Paxillus rubicundulus Ve08.2h10]
MAAAHSIYVRSLGNDGCRMVALGCPTFTRRRKALEKSMAYLKRLVCELGFSILGGFVVLPLLSR